MECGLKTGSTPYYLSRKYGARAKKRARSILQRQKVWSARRNRAALHIIPIWSMEWRAKSKATPHYLLTMKKSRSLAAEGPKKMKFFGEEERRTERMQKDQGFPWSFC